MNKYYLIALIPLILLSGCFNDDKEQTDDNSHLLDGHKKSMDKAKGLEQVIQEGIEKRQKGSQ